MEILPGDLITADLFNELIERIEDLEGRVEILELNNNDGSVLVSQLIPSGTTADPIRVSQELRIVGQNFGFSLGAHRVFFDSVSVTSFLAGSSDNQLVISVPTNLGIPPQGRQVTLTVSNGVTFDSRTITVHPLEQTLAGDIDVIWRDDLSPNPAPNPIPDPATAGPQEVLFAYRLRSRTNVQATFVVNPTISIAAWQDGLEVLNADLEVVEERGFLLNPEQEIDFFVRARLTDDVAGAADFDLTIVSTAGGVIGASSRRFTFDTPVEEGDAAITLAFTDTQIFNLATGNPAPEGGFFDPGLNTIIVSQNHILFMQFEATFTESTIYNVTAELSDGAAGWNIAVTTPNSGSYDETNEETPVNESPSFSVTPQTGATTGTVTFRIQREGEELSQTRVYNLQAQN